MVTLLLGFVGVHEPVRNVFAHMHCPCLLVPLQVGFYVNSWLTFMAVYLNMYALLVYAWAEATEIQAEDVQQIYNVQQVGGCVQAKCVQQIYDVQQLGGCAGQVHALDLQCAAGRWVCRPSSCIRSTMRSKWAGVQAKFLQRIYNALQVGRCAGRVFSGEVQCAAGG